MALKQSFSYCIFLRLKRIKPKRAEPNNHNTLGSGTEVVNVTGAKPQKLPEPVPVIAGPGVDAPVIEFSVATDRVGVISPPQSTPFSKTIAPICVPVPKLPISVAAPVLVLSEYWFDPALK